MRVKGVNSQCEDPSSHRSRHCMCIVSDELYEEAEDLRALLKIIDRRLESELQLGHELDRDGS